MATLESTPIWRDPAKGELPSEYDAVIVVRRMEGFEPDATDAIFRNGAFTESTYGLKYNDVVLWQPFEIPEEYDVSESDTKTETEEDET